MEINLSVAQEATLARIAAEKGCEVEQYVEDVLNLAIADENGFLESLHHADEATFDKEGVRRQIAESLQASRDGKLVDGEAVFEKLFRIDTVQRQGR